MNVRTHRTVLLLWLGIAAAASAATSTGPDTHDTRMLTDPAISKDRIAFIYAGDLWTCNLEGGDVRRMTSSPGTALSPAFSPDGKWIAYSAQHDGNIDVYVVPSEGGVPRRLTWHPGPDIAQGFTPDGKSVVFTSPRAVYTSRYTQLFTVPVEGGTEERLPIPNANRAVYSQDGKRIAYNPGSPQFLQWKRYRGGAVSQVWLYDVASHAIEKVPQPATRANDAGPMWIGDTVYFRSDRDGEFNLFAYDTKDKSLKRVTKHSDFRVLSASAGGDRIVYEQAGYLHLFDPASGASKKLTIGVAADLPETRPRFARETKDRKYIREFSLSPSGVRVAVDFRGEIVTVPAEKGDVRNLTNTPAAHERSPIWSPDGKSIAYFSDESGEYELYLREQDGKGEPKHWKLTGAGFYESPAWSPDSKKIAYVDNSRALYWIDVGDGRDEEDRCRPLLRADQDAARHVVAGLALGRLRASNNHGAHAARLRLLARAGQVVPDHRRPVATRASPSSTAAASTCTSSPRPTPGPVVNWFSLENDELTITRAIYMAVLRKDLPSPLVKESDEEKGAAAAEKKDEKARREEGRGQEGRTEGQDRRQVRTRSPSRRRRSSRSGSTSTAWSTGSSTCRCRRRELSTPAGRRGRPDLLPAHGRRQDGAAALRPEGAQDRHAARRRGRATRSRRTRRSSCTTRRTRGRSWRRPRRRSTGPRASSRPAPSRCGSIRAPSGPRSSTRPGASTATTSTTRTCTALDWKATGDEVRAVPAAPGDARGPEPRDPVDAAASSPSATLIRDGGGDRWRRTSGRSRAACSARTTRSRTAATGSRRSTAASTGTRSCARR